MIVTAELNVFGEQFVIKIDNLIHSDVYSVYAPNTEAEKLYDTQTEQILRIFHEKSIAMQLKQHTKYKNTNECTVGNSDKSENFNL